MLFMAHKITIPFFAFQLHLIPSGNFLAPIHDGSILRINQPMHMLAGKYAEAFQRKVLNKGDYLPLIGHQVTGDFIKATLSVPFAKAQDGVSYPKFELDFDYYFNQREEGVLGIIPVLGLESYAENLEQLEERLMETVRLDFARHKRLQSVQELLTTIWYDMVELKQEPLDLKTFSLKELEDSSSEPGELLLPKVATPLEINKQVVFGRKKELDQLARAVKGKFNKNVILIGPSGVGKTALVWELVRQRRKRKIGERFWETTASVLIKELMRDTGWEDNLAILCKELAGSGDILFIRNLMELFEVGQYIGNDMSMADYLLSYISRGEVTMISECSEEELSKIQLRSPSFSGLFQLIRLYEPKEDLEFIIQEKVKNIAQSKKTYINEEAIQEVIRLNRRFTPYSGMPGKPIRFLESIILHQGDTQKRKSGLHITRSEVIRQFCEDTGMPTFMVDPTIPMHLSQIKRHFNGNVFGQEAAVDSVVDVIASVKTAMTRTGKPIASFLFVGPTGVGKTELAKVLAGFMFGSRNRMIRFDMSEYASPYAVMRLIESGRDGGGLLTAAVRREPFCVLLFDELEKADPTFYDLLLQILSEGRLTDSNGQLVNFCSTIIIMTSNIGARRLQSGSIRLGDQQEDSLAEHYISEVEKHFRPELYNRIDRIIPFAALDRDTVRFVVDREIELFRQREGVQFRRIDLQIADEVLDYLGEAGYHEKYGARQIQRTIREELIIPLAKVLNEHDFDDQYLIQVVLRDGKPFIQLEADPLGLELLLEELEKIQQADHASQLRRKIGILKESMFFIRLESELRQMEIEKNRQRHKFWENKIKGERYTYYLQTKSNVERLQQQIGSLEENLSLASLNLATYNPKVTKELESWETAFFDLKVELYTRLHPKSNTCHFGIYGMNLEPLLDYYKALFARKGFHYEAYAVWYRDKYYNEEIPIGESMPSSELENPNVKIKRKAYVKTAVAIDKAGRLSYKREKKGDLLCGVEFVVTGICPFLYLEGEYGKHQLKISDKESVQAFVQASTEISKSPDGIHRRDFYNRLNNRRSISLNQSIRDTLYEVNREYRRGQLLDILMEKMDLLFETKLDKALFE
jgi:ATP-dependent Clp protease ATP-binding subunit ClpA